MDQSEDFEPDEDDDESDDEEEDEDFESDDLSFCFESCLSAPSLADLSDSRLRRAVP